MKQNEEEMADQQIDEDLQVTWQNWDQCCVMIWNIWKSIRVNIRNNSETIWTGDISIWTIFSSVLVLNWCPKSDTVIELFWSIS